MKSFMSRILSRFKRKNGKDYQFNDIYRVCMLASDELGDYCRAEGYNGRRFNH